MAWKWDPKAAWEDFLKGWVNPITHNGVFWVYGGEEAWQKSKNQPQTPEEKHGKKEEEIAEETHETKADIISQQETQLEADYNQFIADLEYSKTQAQRKWTEYIQGGVTAAYAGGVKGGSLDVWKTEMTSRAAEVQSYLTGKEETATTKYEAGKQILKDKGVLNDLGFEKTMEDINWWLYKQEKSGMDQWTTLGANVGMSLLGSGLMSGNWLMAGIGGILAGGSVLAGQFTGSSYTPYGGI